MIEFLSGSWVQLFLWINAGAVIFLFSHNIRGSAGAWNLISIGIILIGCRIGYKLLPFYKASEMLEASRYLLGIAGVVFLFWGIFTYCETVIRAKNTMEEL